MRRQLSLLYDWIDLMNEFRYEKKKPEVFLLQKQRRLTNRAKASTFKLSPLHQNDVTWHPPSKFSSNGAEDFRIRMSLSIFSSNVKSVLLYDCESWKVTSKWVK
ncbi:hypothetical protein RRG08_038842 [Elysia crispata]|uniref:Uncharacterized protein n=1 Tax=Elysia crispata TaxID=231223 RepID=A0AAE0YSE6_9GAST|nr:hypothetical protein RRG08_038842 [Elysia crispata]